MDQVPGVWMSDTHLVGASLRVDVIPLDLPASCSGIPGIALRHLVRNPLEDRQKEQRVLVRDVALVVVRVVWRDRLLTAAEVLPGPASSSCDPFDRERPFLGAGRDRFCEREPKVSIEKD